MSRFDSNIHVQSSNENKSRMSLDGRKIWLQAAKVDCAPTLVFNDELKVCEYSSGLEWFRSNGDKSLQQSERKRRKWSALLYSAYFLPFQKSTCSKMADKVLPYIFDSRPIIQTKLSESRSIVYFIMKNFGIWQWETLKYFKWICSRFVTGQRTCQTAPSGRLSFWKEDSQRADKHLCKYTEIKLLNKDNCWRFVQR